MGDIESIGGLNASGDKVFVGGLRDADSRLVVPILRLISHWFV